MQPKNVRSLQDAIKAMHGCDSRYIESVPVHEVFQGQTAWQGTVEVFHLIGHVTAARAYTWQYRDGGDTKTVSVLEIPPVNSPQTAVQAAIAAQAKNARASDKKP
jgi:hypothetical protein